MLAGAALVPNRAVNTLSRLGLLSSLVCLTQLLPLTANAQPTDDGERASIMLGAFITDRDSTTRLDSDEGEGTEINLEDDLGLESSMSVARLGGYVWLGKGTASMGSTSTCRARRRYPSTRRSSSATRRS